MITEGSEAITGGKSLITEGQKCASTFIIFGLLAGFFTICHDTNSKYEEGISELQAASASLEKIYVLPAKSSELL